VRRAEDVTAPCAEHRNQFLNLAPHILHGAKGQRRLHANPALKAEPVAKAALERSRVHPLDAEVQRLPSTRKDKQDINAHIDPLRASTASIAAHSV